MIVITIEFIAQIRRISRGIEELDRPKGEIQCTREGNRLSSCSIPSQRTGEAIIGPISGQVFRSIIIQHIAVDHDARDITDDGLEGHRSIVIHLDLSILELAVIVTNGSRYRGDDVLDNRRRLGLIYATRKQRYVIDLLCLPCEVRTCRRRIGRSRTGNGKHDGVNLEGRYIGQNNRIGRCTRPCYRIWINVVITRPIFQIAYSLTAFEVNNNTFELT